MYQAERAGTAAYRRDLRNSYNMRYSVIMLFTNQGILHAEDKQTERWKEHFNDVLNRQNSDVMANITIWLHQQLEIVT
jgi:hypothetical protein